MIGPRTVAGGALLGGAGLLAYAVRGRSAQLLAPSVYRGPANRRTIALTFDDGPSESTPALLEILRQHRVPATFFQCGANIRRLPAIAREVVSAGHEIGNHSDTHPRLYLQSAAVILNEFSRAQRTMRDSLGAQVRYLRAPFGVRWFGFREMQQRLGLMGVMWSVIGRDWALDANGVIRRVLRSVSNGSIVCLHDGRELQSRPDIRSTLASVREIVPVLSAQGYRFQTVSDLLCPKR